MKIAQQFDFEIALYQNFVKFRANFSKNKGSFEKIIILRGGYFWDQNNN